MKFCTKCGHEINDGAIICTGCGCMVESTSQNGNLELRETKTGGPQWRAAKTQSILPEVFNFVFSMLSICCLFFFSWAIVYAHLSVRSFYVSFYLDYDLTIVSMIFAFASAVFGVVCFILTLVKKMELKEIFASITRMVIGLALAMLLIIAAWL